MSIFATKFRNCGVMANPVFHFNVFVSNSFGDLAVPIESLDRENQRKNTAGPNEFTDFEKNEIEHPKRTKTILATTWAEHPASGITLRPAPMAGQRTTKRRYIPPAHDPSQSGRQVRLDAGTPHAELVAAQLGGAGVAVTPIGPQRDSSLYRDSNQ